MDELLADLDTMLSALQAPERFVLLGHSFGGTLAQATNDILIAARLTWMAMFASVGVALGFHLCYDESMEE